MHQVFLDVPRRRTPRVATALSLALSLGWLGAGCSDDDPKPTPASDAGDETSDGGTPDGGDTDAGDTDAGETPAALSEVYSGVVTGIDDLRGLTYAADGKIYGSGFVTVDGDAHVAIARFNADGSPDSAFGTAGVVTRNLIAAADDTVESGKGAEDSYGIVELADGNLIVQANKDDGQGGRDVVLLKLSGQGAFDDAFGVVKLDLGWADADLAEWPGATPPSDSSWGIALDKSTATEKVVVFASGPAPKGALDSESAQRTDADRYVLRVLASDGALDGAFADGGIFSVDVDGANLSDGARRGIVEADGSIVSAGYTNFGEGFGNHVTVIRLDADGTPDAEFGFGNASPGVTKFNPFLSTGGMAEAYAVAAQSSGRYVTTGYGVSNFEIETVENDLVSFGLKDGALDATWGAEGSFAVQSEGDPAAGKGARANRENGRDLVALSDDRTLHVGCYDDFSALFLFSADGALDESFGAGGKLVFEHPTPFFKVAISADGKRIAASTSSGPAGAFLAIVEVVDN